MEGIQSQEFAASLSILPGYPNIFLSRRISVIVCCQLVLCIASSLLIAFVLLKKLYLSEKMSWRKVVRIMGPIGKRVQNLEKEKAVWNSYLEWIEEYCTVYYGLLSFLNTAVTDLDKICNTRSLRTFSESSGITSKTESTKEGDSQYDGILTSDLDWEGMTSDEDVQLLANFAKALNNLKGSEKSVESDGMIREEASTSRISSNINPNNDFATSHSQLDSFKETSDEESRTEEPAALTT